MKKLFASALVVLSLFVFAACESNPGIAAAKDFLNDPTRDNLMKIHEVEKSLTGEVKEEYEEWCEEHEDEILKAILTEK